MSLDTYRKKNPLPESKLTQGLLEKGEQREVFIENMDHPVYVESYTVPEAARAMGRSMLGFKRWIADGLIPPPVLIDTVRGFKQYSRGELDTIRKEIVKHEKEFTYFTSRHDTTIHRVWQAVQAYRARHV